MNKRAVVPTTFWYDKTEHEGEIHNIELVGSWSNWKDKLPMKEEEKGLRWKITSNIPVGIHSYKFIVDSVWKVAHHQPTILDSNENENHVVHVVREPDTVVPRSWSEPNLFAMEESNNSATDHSDFSKKKLKNHFFLAGVYEKKEPEEEPEKPVVQREISSKIQLANKQLLLVMVGLPARGKSFISRKLSRYLTWLGYNCKVFNLGNYRRKEKIFPRASFFDASNDEGKNERDRLAQVALKDIQQYFNEEGGHVAILDGTNSNNARRNMIRETMKGYNTDHPDKISGGVKLIFIEIICNDPEIIQRNILATKLTSPDYRGQDPEEIVKDFTKRIHHYEQNYQTVEDNLAYIKIFDVGRQTVCNRISGYLPNRIVFFLNNLHIMPRPIFFSRHGGGDSPLTKYGHSYAAALKNFISNPKQCGLESDFNPEENLCVWTSTMQRTLQTASIIPCGQFVAWRCMTEIEVGICDGMSEAEIKEKMNDEYTARQEDKFHYRYPRGESYVDVIHRLEPVIIELERQKNPVLVIGHRAVLRCLIAYFKDVSPEDLPWLDVPLHTVMKLTPQAYGTDEEKFELIPKKEEK